MSSKPGGFSKNVLNMKFMKQAEKKAEGKQEEELNTKLKDLSEWKTSNAEALKKKAEAKPKVISVGFTGINNLTNGSPIIGRRTFGETAKKEEKPKEENDLDQIWKKQRAGDQDLKRERKDSEGSPKKSHSKKRKATQ